MISCKFHLKRLLIVGAILLGFAVTAVYAETVEQSSDQELFLVSQKAFEDGFYDVAIRYLQQLFVQYPQTDKTVQARLLLGQCYYFKNQYLKAFDIFHALLGNTDYKDAILFWLGETYLKGGDYKQAAQQYQQVIDAFPRSEYAPQAYYSLGWILFEQEKYPEAIRFLSQLVRMYPQHALVEDAEFKIAEAQYNAQNFSAAIEAFNKWISVYPKSTRQAEAFFYIAESWYHQDVFADAATYYLKTAQTAYDNKLILSAQVSLGWCRVKQKQWAEAAKIFVDAKSFAQNKGIISEDVFLGLANYYVEMKQYDQALDAYQQLIAQLPQSGRLADAYLGEANVYYLQKKYADAARADQTLIDRFGKEKSFQDIVEKAYFGLAWAYLKKGDIDSSIQTFNAVKAKSDNTIVKVSALTQIGDAYQDVGQLDKAVEVYDAILKEYPDSSFTDYVQYRQGIALLKNDKIDAAALSFQTLQVNFPQSLYINDVQYYLAVTYFKKGDWDSARIKIKTFLKNVSADSDFGDEAQQILALSNFNLADYAAAAEIFQRIINKASVNKTITQNAAMGLAKAYYKMGKQKEALAHFDALVAQYPGTDIMQESLIWLGDHYLSAAEYDRAVFYYEKYVATFPESEQSGVVYYELGQAYTAKGAYDKAVAALRRIKDVKGDILSARARMAIADIFERDMQPDAALETYQKIIVEAPEFVKDACVKIAEVHMNRREYEPALAAYQKAIHAEGKNSKLTNAELQFRVADIYEMQRRDDRATEEYLKIPYLYPQEKEWVVKAYLRLGRIFEDKEDFPQARLTYQKIVALNVEESKFARERLEALAVK
ncbi:MAG: tetratricopeptide repeat protein [Candidatus Omnitrophica bacterium]|nr:tetratricopeptide repeat protein [Candidatus Omnitrophota bacterium]